MFVKRDAGSAVCVYKRRRGEPRAAEVTVAAETPSHNSSLVSGLQTCFLQRSPGGGVNLCQFKEQESSHCFVFAAYWYVCASFSKLISDLGFLACKLPVFLWDYLRFS